MTDKERRPSKKNSMKENKRFPYRKQGGKIKVNKWKVATIILAIIFIDMIIVDFFMDKNESRNGLVMKESDWANFKAISNNKLMVFRRVDSGKVFICDLNKEECKEVIPPEIMEEDK